MIPPPLNFPALSKEDIRRQAQEVLGFDDCRFCDPRDGLQLDEYQRWLDDEFSGEMGYLKEHLKFKQDPKLLLPGVTSAIVLIKNYKNIPYRQLTDEFKIARYAVGEDYHHVLLKKLKALSAFIKALSPSAEFYIGVDSRPLAERSLALKSGIGFRGKNTMVIKPGLGSYFFIGVILTTLNLEADKPMVWDCGRCRLCLDACPTGALDKPFELDARKCISYQTIERKTLMSDVELKESKGWLFGCDICQEVCPYNHDRIPLTDWPEFHPSSGVGFKVFANLPDDTLILKRSPLHRSRKRLRENWRAACSLNRDF